MVGGPGENGEISLDEMVATDVGSLCDEAARQHLLGLHRARARLDAALVEAAGALDTRGLHRADGARSAAGWMAARVDQHRGRCAADVTLARALRDMPVVAAAFRAGRLGRVKVDLLVEVRTPEVAQVFSVCEETLVAEVERLRVDAAGRFLRAWHAQARLRVGWCDPDEPLDEPEPRVAVDLSKTFGGRWVLDGEMDAEHGTIIRGAIDAEVDAMFRAGVFSTDDGLTPAERRGQALAQIVNRGAKATVVHGRPRPSIEVICDERTLLGEPVTDPTDDDGEDLRSRVCQLLDGTPVHPVTLGRLLCGARMHRLVVNAVGEVLDAGRDIRYANRAQRRALRFRHAGHCAFPGCEAPDAWCDAHHIDPWEPLLGSDGGPTDMDNLIPLCRFHHHLIHEGGWTLELDSDGTVRVERPPQPGQQPRRVTPVLAHQRPRDPHPAAAIIRQRMRALWAETGRPLPDAA